MPTSHLRKGLDISPGDKDMIVMTASLKSKTDQGIKNYLKPSLLRENSHLHGDGQTVGLPLAYCC